MNMYCADCGRDDICLCHIHRLDVDPTQAAVEILHAARAIVWSDWPGIGTLPIADWYLLHARSLT